MKMRHLSGRRKDGGMELRGPLCRWRAPGGSHNCTHRCRLRGQLLNQVFPLNVHRNIKTCEITVSAACCHHLPGPKGTHDIARSCSSVSHGPVPSWAEHRGACVGGECAGPCLALGPGGGFSSHSRFHQTQKNPDSAQNTGTDRAPKVAASHSCRAYRREAGLGHNPLIKMENPGLHGVCPYKSHHASRDERQVVHWPTQSLH